MPFSLLPLVAPRNHSHHQIIAFFPRSFVEAMVSIFFLFEFRQRSVVVAAVAAAADDDDREDP